MFREFRAMAATGIRCLVHHDVLRGDHDIHRMAERIHPERVVPVEKPGELQGGQVARGIIHVHVFRTGIGRPNGAGLRDTCATG